jgi:hypothetical protein
MLRPIVIRNVMPVQLKQLLSQRAVALTAPLTLWHHASDASNCYTHVHAGAYNTAAAAAAAVAAPAVTQASRRAAARAGFDSMNGVVASLLTDLTASARFPGSLNVDLNEITTNLVPFPRLHYLIPALSPLRLGGKANSKGVCLNICVYTVICC